MRELSRHRHRQHCPQRTPLQKEGQHHVSVRAATARSERSTAACSWRSAAAAAAHLRSKAAYEGLERNTTRVYAHFEGGVVPTGREGGKARGGKNDARVDEGSRRSLTKGCQRREAFLLVMRRSVIEQKLRLGRRKLGCSL